MRRKAIITKKFTTCKQLLCEFKNSKRSNYEKITRYIELLCEIKNAKNNNFKIIFKISIYRCRCTEIAATKQLKNKKNNQYKK